MIHQAAALKIMFAISKITEFTNITNNLSNGITNINFAYEKLYFEYKNLSYIFERESKCDEFRIIYVQTIYPDMENTWWRHRTYKEMKDTPAVLFKLYQSLYKSKQVL